MNDFNSIKLFDFPKNFLQYIDCEKHFVAVDNNWIKEIYWFKNHVRVNLKNGGQLRYFESDTPNILLKISY